MPTFVNWLAAICTIAGVSIVAIYRWIRSHSAIYRVHDPKELVAGANLSYADVERGIRLLSEDARLYRPTVIIGINRGGAIVAGLLAKQLGLPTIEVMAVNCDRPIGSRVAESRLGADVQGRILLVDDAARKGEHMREATAYLAQNYPDVGLRRSVLLKMVVPHQGPEREMFQTVPIEKAAFETHDASVALPWDAQT
jgi:hypoxanthine phosphoribosyltransferase